MARFVRRLWAFEALVLLLVGMLGLWGPVQAQAPAAAPAAAASAAAVSIPAEAPKGPEKVEFGVYVNSINALDIKAGTVEVELYVWFKTTNGELNLLETFEIMNGRIEDRNSVFKKSENGIHLSSIRLNVKLKQNFNLSTFPLDEQKLVLKIEDYQNDASTLVYVPDVANSRIAEEVMVSGYKVDGLKLEVKPFKYKSNFGDASAGSGESVYSRAEVQVTLHREGIGYFLKMFGMVFLSAAVSFLVFFIKPTDLDPRFGLGIGGIFAVIASNYVISGLLPDTHLLSMGELIMIITQAFIFFALVQSAWVLRLAETDREDLADKIDLAFGLLTPLVYAGVVWWIVRSFIG